MLAALVIGACLLGQVLTQSVRLAPFDYRSLGLTADDQAQIEGLPRPAEQAIWLLARVRNGITESPVDIQSMRIFLAPDNRAGRIWRGYTFETFRYGPPVEVSQGRWQSGGTASTYVYVLPRDGNSRPTEQANWPFVAPNIPDATLIDLVDFIRTRPPSGASQRLDFGALSRITYDGLEYIVSSRSGLEAAVRRDGDGWRIVRHWELVA